MLFSGCNLHVSELNFCLRLQIPYVGLNFAVYESLKDWLIKAKPFGIAENSELSVVTRLACGAAAGTVGQTVAYPLDVIRRRMQMVGWKDAASIVTAEGRSKETLEYTGMIDAFRKTVRHEGFGALYKGLIPNSVKVFILPLKLLVFQPLLVLIRWYQFLIWVKFQFWRFQRISVFVENLSFQTSRREFK